MLPVLPVLVAALVQAPQARVAGVVRELDSGRPIGGATVVVGDLGRVTTSGEDGGYVLEDVPPGPQHVSVSALGHAARIVHALVPSSGVLELDLALAIDPIELAGVTVRPPVVPDLVTIAGRHGATDRGALLGTARFHPLLAEPDALQILAGGSVSVDPEAPSGLHVRGGPDDHTAYELDGFPVFDPVHAGGLFAAWSPDAISGVSLQSAAPSVGSVEALGGVVSGYVRDAGQGLAAEATLSTTHGSATMHGPIAGGRAGYVASVRSGFIGTFAPRGETSYLKGESGDGLVKLGVDALGGTLGLLLYSSENELGGPSVVGMPASSAENRFEWTGATLGASWNRASADTDVRFKVWRAEAAALANWNASAAPVALDSRRSELGAEGAVGWRLGPARQRVGLRLVRVETAYEVGAPIEGALTLPTLFTESANSFGGSLDARFGVTLTPALGDVYVSPRGQLDWSLAEAVTLTVAAARTHQFTQSLANSESVVRHIFPAGLALVAGSAGMPVPTSTQVVAGLSWAVRTDLRVGVEAYARALDDLALVAPVEPGPFSSGSFDVGGGSVRGVSMEASSSGARFSWLARYGWQDVRVEGSTASYRPSYGVAHAIDTGISFFPTGTLSLRVGATAGWGRSATDQTAFEWESCNLLDRGCELAGSPTLDGPAGGRRLPSYLRLDAGARKHWHLRAMGRDGMLGLFGTVTNVLGRRNELLLAGGDPVDMRPLSPLVIGVDWRF